MSASIIQRKAPLWKFAEVSPPTPEFSGITEADEVTFIPLEDVWPANRADDFQVVPWEQRLTGYTPFRRGDLLLPKVTPTVTHGRAMITDIATELGVASTEVYTVRARRGTDPRWLAYVLVGAEFLGLAGASVQGTGGLKRISTQFVESYPLPDHSPGEQRAIADYLDRETAEVDAMSADLDELEALLTERKVNALVRRIDQNTGDGALPLGTVVRSHLGGSGIVGLQNEASKDETGILKTSAISTGEFRKSESRVISPDDLARVNPDHAVRPGDLLLNRLNSPEYVGAMAFVPEDPGSLIFSDKIWRLDVAPNLDPEYLSMWSRTPAYRKQVDFSIVGTSQSMQSLGFGTFQRFRINVPLLEQQREIVEVVQQETAEIDAMLADISELRDLLAERRAAVIAAAVTGQIKIPAAKEPTHV